MRNFVARIVALLLVSAGTLAASAANAQYPDRPIRVVVPWPPGATTDVAARIFGERLAQKLNANVIVENRGGGNGIVGTNAVARAAPDGYTIEFATSEPLTINPHLQSVPYNVEKDLEPIAFIGKTFFVLAARTDFPASDVASTVALARSSSGKVTVGTYGIANLFLGSFEAATGSRYTAVPFQGAGPAINAVMGAHVDLTLAASFSAAQHLRNGRIKLIAVGSAERLSFLPDTPTFIEQGIAGFEIGNWLSLFAPAGTPASIRESLRKATEEIVRSPDFVEKFRSIGVEAQYMGSEELRAFMRTDSARWAKVVADKGLKTE